MHFNSFEFALFFPVVTLFYFLLRGTARIYWLLAASLVFYAAYIPAYTLILVGMVLIDYLAGLLLASTESPAKRQLYLALSLISNLGILCAFKLSTQWALPIGLSFHTFQSMAYTIEVYKRRYPAERSLPHLALYVLFYPQLVAGPIERPQNLLRQLHLEHNFSKQRLNQGLRQMFWGLFKKAAIADRLAIIADSIFNQTTPSGPVVIIGALAFSFQIYCDFSGYSDMALGAARVMGFELTTNFHRPYFAGSFQDFWRRWHISLSTWFRDYVYFPLGGTASALIAVFLLSGVWHGSHWTFVIWGALHAAFRLIERQFPKQHRPLLVFACVTYGWLFFRATSVTQAFQMTLALVHGWGTVLDPINFLRTVTQGYGGTWNYIYAIAGVVILLAVDFCLERGWCLEARPAWQRAVAYNVALVSLYSLWAKDNQQFIYFKF